MSGTDHDGGGDGGGGEQDDLQKKEDRAGTRSKTAQTGCALMRRT